MNERRVLVIQPPADFTGQRKAMPTGYSGVGALSIVAWLRHRGHQARFLNLGNETVPTSNRVYLLDIPDCTTEDLPGHVRGQVERYFAFEMNGTCPVEAIGDKVDAMPESELYVKTAMRGEKADYSLVAKTFHDSLVRVKRPECGSCRHDDEGCPGVSRLYVERFGWDEFAPVGRKA